MNYGIIYVIALIILIAGFITWYQTYSHNRKHRIKNVFWSSFTICIISVVILSSISISSYSSYIDIKIFKDTKYTQYYDAINKYNDLISQERGKKSELTDLKFQGLQENAYILIKDYRNSVVDFNEAVSGKRIMSKNILIGFLIFEPDEDIKVLQITQTPEKANVGIVTAQVISTSNSSIIIK